MKKIRITTLGCKVNQYESASFRTGFEEQGHHVVSTGKDNDIVVINTCTVTGKAGAQSRQELRRSLRENPGAKIVITGCYSQIESEEIYAMEELRNREISIVSNGDKHLLVDLVLQEKTKIPSTIKELRLQKEVSHLPVSNFGKRTRAYLKIQDGCDAFCTYCIVPHARGKSRSVAVEDVLDQANDFAKKGYKEIVVTGIHVGYYGSDLPGKTDVATIMERLCRKTPEIRYRLSSIEPLEITPKLMNIMAENDNFMPHLHIPLQSGNDEILLRMNRRYNTVQFREKLEWIQQNCIDIAIGLDVLAGFPGETEEQFESTRSFLQSLDFTYLHVFPYSKRQGTPAASYPNQVKKSEKEKRVATLRKLADDKKQSYYSRFIGKKRQLLVEGKRTAQGQLKGFTDNYIPVVFSGDDHLKNSIVSVSLEKLGEREVSGKLILG